MDLYFMKYNNYYNRIVKKFDNIDDYVDYMIDGSPTQTVLWNPGDGVDTVQVLNMNQMSDVPNYCVVCDNDVIDSRWFVLDTTYNRRGQVIVTLRRDLIADGLDKVLSSPAYIEKAWVSNLQDPAIYNSEDIQFNKIKKKHVKLTQNGNIAWIAMYIQKLTADQNVTVKEIQRPDITVSSLANWEFNAYVNSPKAISYRDASIIYTYLNALQIQTRNTVSLNDGYASYQAVDPVDSQDSQYRKGTYAASKLNRNPIIATLNGQFDIRNDYDALSGLNGKIIKDTSTGKAYVISVSSAVDQYNEFLTAGGTFNAANAQFLAAGGTGTPGTQGIRLTATVTYGSVTLVETRLTTFNYTIPSTHQSTIDTPYDIILIPFYDGKVKIFFDSTSSYTIYCTKTSALSIATAAMKDSGGFIYDAQIVPYFYYNDRLQADIDGTPQIFMDGFGDGEYKLIKNNDDNVSCMFFIPRSSFTFQNLASPSVLVSYKDALTKKTDNQTLSYRFCSPNYASVFEFSPAKNDGYRGYNVSCTLKPGTPYIRVCPIFEGIYDKNYSGEQRGLILSGDFSITRVDSAYTSYLNNNKNYELMFNREIENLTTTNTLDMNRAKWQATFGALTGTITAAAGGAIAGSSMGPVGAIVGGAAAGGVTAAGSIIGGVKDVEDMRARQAETLNYKKDMFNMNIENIRAQPNTLTKVSSYCVDNEYFPILEVYDCTDVEKEAFKMKIKYNGMTINRIGVLNTFVVDGEHYYKARLIRLPEDNEDYHFWTSVADEVNMGFFLDPKNI